MDTIQNSETAPEDAPRPESTPASEDAMEEQSRYIVVLKVGGNELDDEAFLFGLAKAVRSVMNAGHFPVIVHGGGKTIASYQERLGLETHFVEGLRVTDEPSLDVAEMVLSGLMNKRIVRALVNADIRAAGPGFLKDWCFADTANTLDYVQLGQFVTLRLKVWLTPQIDGIVPRNTSNWLQPVIG